MSLNENERLELADTIDRLISTDIPGRGFVNTMYPAARSHAGEPLVKQAGDKLLDRLQNARGQAVLICTGATVLRAGIAEHIGETDGPPGAIALARFIGHAFSALPILVTDPGQGPMLARACELSGLFSVSFDALKEHARHSPHVSAVYIVECPDDELAAERFSEELVELVNPVSLVAIEKAGKNEKNTYHNSLKLNTSQSKARAENLFDACHARNILTVGIGDGGNELGMGNIREAILEQFPAMRTCACPCEGSIVANQKADCLIVAAVSNWGAYGLLTYMARVNATPYSGHSPQREADMLAACAQAGYIHIDGYSSTSVDGLPSHIHVSIVSLLSCLAFWPALKHGRDGTLTDMLPK